MTVKSWAVCAVVRRRSRERHCTNWSAYGVRHACRGFARAKSMCAKPTKTLWGSLRRKRVAGRFVQHGERVCKRVGGRDDTEILGEKNFSVQEERSGGSTGEILELKGLRCRSCRPRTFCITAGPVREVLFPRCAHPPRCATKEH